MWGDFVHLHLSKDVEHLPSGYDKIAIENDPIGIVDFPIEHTAT